MGSRIVRMRKLESNQYSAKEEKSKLWRPILDRKFDRALHGIRGFVIVILFPDWPALKPHDQFEVRTLVG